MHVKTFWAGLIVLLLGGAAIGWYGMLTLIPYQATDRLWERFQKRAGSRINVLTPSIIRNARINSVPRDNADTLTRSAIIDLADGPLVFEADVPTLGDYWSVSLFAHNTDTFFVANDRTAGPGRFRLLIRRPDQAVPAGEFDAVAISPTRKSFLIIRAVMVDRNDAARVAVLDAQVKRATLNSVGAGS